MLFPFFALIGYGNSRRMSERDIPSRISHEQELQMRAHRNNMNASAHHLQQQQQPRIQGSKSVPTLNDDNQMQVTANGQPPQLQQRRQPNNEIPPPYSVGGPHSQYNSMPKSSSDFNTGQHLKQPNDNLNNTRNYASQHSMANYNTIGSYSPSRPDSQMSIHSQQNRMSSSQSQQLYPEERHYQNIQLYQIQPTPSSVQTSKPSPNSMSSLPQRIHHSSHTSLQNDGQHYNPQQNQRPLSALVSNREPEQYMAQMANSPGTPTSPRLPIGMNMMSATDQFHYPQQYPNQQMSSRQTSQDFNDSQQLMDYPSRNYPPPHPPYVDPRQRDLMRQEAKMDEMREELKRREERMQSGGPQLQSLIRNTTSNGLWPHRPQYYAQQMPINSGAQLRMAPPPAPKPSRPSAVQLLSNYGQNSYLRNSYREPNDLLPQQQANQPPPTVSYRYGPSGYPPSRQSEPLRSPNASSQKMPFTDAINNNNRVINNSEIRKNHSGVVSPSPWEREEKERVIIYVIFFLLKIYFFFKRFEIYSNIFLFVFS